MKNISRNFMIMFIILGSILMLNGCDDPNDDGCGAQSWPRFGKIVAILHNKSNQELHMWAYSSTDELNERGKIGPTNKLMPNETRRVNLGGKFPTEASTMTLVFKTGQNGVTIGTFLYDITYEQLQTSCGTFRITYNESGKFNIFPNCL